MFKVKLIITGSKIIAEINETITLIIKGINSILRLCTYLAINIIGVPNQIINVLPILFVAINVISVITIVTDVVPVNAINPAFADNCKDTAKAVDEIGKGRARPTRLPITGAKTIDHQ